MIPAFLIALHFTEFGFEVLGLSNAIIPFFITDCQQFQKDISIIEITGLVLIAIVI